MQITIEELNSLLKEIDPNYKEADFDNAIPYKLFSGRVELDTLRPSKKRLFSKSTDWDRVEGVDLSSEVKIPHRGWNSVAKYIANGYGVDVTKGEYNIYFSKRIKELDGFNSEVATIKNASKELERKIEMENIRLNSL